jgi:hypothetical protein
LGAKFLVVLCAGSVLLLVEDALTSIVNGTLVGVSLGWQASPSGVWLFPIGRLNLGFITEEKLVVVLITPSLGVPNWSVIYIINTAPPTTKVLPMTLDLFYHHVLIYPILPHLSSFVF